MQTLRHDISQLISKSGRLSLSELATRPASATLETRKQGRITVSEGAIVNDAISEGLWTSDGKMI